jgi:uncharacterized protein YecE (DUF72 family)
MSLAVELRDEGMHLDASQFEEYFNILSEFNCTPLITDVSGRRDLLHMAITNQKVFVRWVGNGLHKTDFERIKEWKNRISEWSKRGITEIYFMLHEPENLKTPEIGQYLAEELENIQYIQHRGPTIIKEPPNLFT